MDNYSTGQNAENPNQVSPELENIHEGMSVYDSNGDKIGVVDRIFMGAEHGRGEGAATTPKIAMQNPSLVDEIARIFDPDQMPDEIQHRLYYEGFVRVDSKRLFAADRYILPSQIAQVTNDRVNLKVPYKDLIKR